MSDSPVVPTPAQEIGEFHQRDGWYFKRLEDGSVRIRHNDDSQIIPPNEWESVIRELSAPTEKRDVGASTASPAREAHITPDDVENAREWLAVRGPIAPTLGVPSTATTIDLDADGKIIASLIERGAELQAEIRRLESERESLIRDSERAQKVIEAATKVVQDAKPGAHDLYQVDYSVFNELDDAMADYRAARSHTQEDDSR